MLNYCINILLLYFYSYPTNPTDQMDRIINSHHTERLMNLLKEEKEKDYSKVVIGGLEGCNPKVYIFSFSYLCILG